VGLAGVWMVLVMASAAGCDLLKSKSKKPFGEECATDADCESLECATYGSICTKSCTYDKDCGGSYVCRAKDVGSGNQCSKPSGAAPNGACNSSQECQHGICLKKEGQTEVAGVCSKYCEAVGDCPAGMQICDAISGGSIKMCIPGDATAPAAERPVFVAPKPTGPIKPAASAGADAGAKPGDAGAGAPTDAGATTKPDAAAPADAGATATVDAGAKDAGGIIVLIPTGSASAKRPSILIRPPPKP
jgi:hypothetical protein